MTARRGKTSETLSDEEWDSMFAQMKASTSSKQQPSPARPESVHVRGSTARWLQQCGWPVGESQVVNQAHVAIWITIEKVLKHHSKLYGITKADAMRAIAPRLAEGSSIWRLKGGSMYDWVCSVLNEAVDEHHLNR
jgi:hypothetical protein